MQCGELGNWYLGSIKGASFSSENFITQRDTQVRLQHKDIRMDSFLTWQSSYPLQWEVLRSPTSKKRKATVSWEKPSLNQPAWLEYHLIDTVKRFYIKIIVQKVLFSDQSRYFYHEKVPKKRAFDIERHRR